MSALAATANHAALWQGRQSFAKYPVNLLLRRNHQRQLKYSVHLWNTSILICSIMFKGFQKCRWIFQKIPSVIWYCRCSTLSLPKTRPTHDPLCSHVKHFAKQAIYTYLWSLGELSWVVALKLSYHWMARTNNRQNGMIEYWVWNGQLWVSC